MNATYQGYPPMLAGGVGTHDFPVQMELYAGDMPVFTAHGVAGATALEQFRSLGRDASGLIVPWDPEARGTVGNAFATGTLTFSTGAPTAADTVTINGVAITAVANGATPTAHQYRVGTDITTAGDNIAACINADPATFLVTASNAGGVVTLTANAAGTGANAITTTESGTHTAFGAGTLAGGSDITAALPQSKLIGFAAQPCPASGNVPYFAGGNYNYRRMIWPLSITTLLQMQAACDRSVLMVDKVL